MMMIGLAALLMVQAADSGDGGPSKLEAAKGDYEQCMTQQTAQDSRADPATRVKAVMAACGKPYDKWVDAVSADQSPDKRAAAKAAGADLREPLTEVILMATDGKARAGLAAAANADTQSDDPEKAQAAARFRSTSHAYAVCMSENAHWMSGGDQKKQAQALAEACGGQYDSMMNVMLSGKSAEVRAFGKSISAPVQDSLANALVTPEAGVTKVGGKAGEADAAGMAKTVVAPQGRAACGSGLSSPTDPTALSCGPEH